MQAIESNKPHEQFLTFVIDDEEYAIGILRVKEIIAYDVLTRVPRAASYIRGIINLRGSVVPVIDLAARFGFRPTEVGRSTCIVIVEVALEREPVVIGLLVDAVSQVVELSADEIEPPPQFGFGSVRADFLTGMAGSSSGRKFVLILDIDRVLSQQECAGLIEETAGETAASA